MKFNTIPIALYLVACTMLLLSSGQNLSAQPTKEWLMHKITDGTHPSGIEQRMLWLMNRARANPSAEGAFLADTGDEATEFAISFYGVDLGRMESEFSNIPPKPPAAFDKRLYEASRQHSAYMISVNAQTHEGQSGRVDSCGFKYSSLLLSVFAYCENPLYGHASLNIDIGGPSSEGGMQPGRGHRMAIMSSSSNLPLLSNVGIALVPESDPSTDIGPYVFSGAYAGAVENRPDEFNRFIVGTVWTDKNGNELYDDGEGLSGVRVQPDHGGWHATTGLAGGYAIPVEEAGTYKIVFSGGDSPAAYSKKVSVGESSVLIDAETSALTPVILPFEVSLARSPSGELMLNWSGGRPPYQVQMTRTLEEPWQNYGTPTRDLSASLPAGGNAGFFRVLSVP